MSQLVSRRPVTILQEFIFLSDSDFLSSCVLREGKFQLFAYVCVLVIVSWEKI